MPYAGVDPHVDPQTVIEQHGDPNDQDHGPRAPPLRSSRPTRRLSKDPVKTHQKSLPDHHETPRSLPTCFAPCNGGIHKRNHVASRHPLAGVSSTMLPQSTGAFGDTMLPPSTGGIQRFPSATGGQCVGIYSVHVFPDGRILCNPCT